MPGIRRWIARSWLLSRVFYRLRGVPLSGSPEDEVWYFAYGANMHDSTFRERRGMAPREWRAGRLPGYRLRFNLDGRPRGFAAPANIEAAEGREVWGVLYKLTRAALVRLDATEGLRYRPAWLTAEDEDGQPVTAAAYIAQGNVEDGAPSLRYLTLLREGARAHGLPAHYLDFLDQVQPARQAPG